MNQKSLDYRRQRRIEALILAIITIYILVFVGDFNSFRRLEIMEFVLDMCLLVFAWTLFLIKYKGYRERVYATFASLQIMIILSVLIRNDIETSILVIVTGSALVALYMIPELEHIMAILYSLVLLYYIFIAQSMEITLGWEGLQLLMKLLAGYFVQNIAVYLIKRQLEIQKSQDEKIKSLKQAEQSKDDFLANVSHEIRTPIHAINGISTLLLRENLPQDVFEKVSNIQAEGQNLLAVVSDILDFSELQSGHIELVEEEYNITSMVNNIVNMTMAMNKEKNLEVIVDIDPNIPRGLVGDIGKLSRVIMNLVHNAIKFTNEGGISIHFSYRKENYGINLMVEVRDTGIGINEENREKLFEMFNQLDGKRNRQAGGIGLGLAISKVMISKMGGFITVKSEEGQGTQIQFTIPQKVSNWKPIAKVKQPFNINAAIYVNMNKFSVMEIRDEYNKLFHKVIQDLDVPGIVCSNLKELKRHVEREYLTHLLISSYEYKEDTQFFDELSKQMKLLVVCDPNEDVHLENNNLHITYKPFHILSILLALNDDAEIYDSLNRKFKREEFIAPEAKILAVDDNRMNLKVLESLLQKYEINVVSVMSGAEALEAIESKDFDFVFMDHMMPEMDGVETFKRLRRKVGNYYNSVPVVMLTANAVSGMREMFLSEGFNEFVAKPIEMSALERILRTFIPEYKIIAKPKQTQKQETKSAPENMHKNSELPKETQNEPVAVEEEASDVAKSTEEDAYGLGELDVKTGLTYCGSKEGYINVLQMHFDSGEQNKEDLEKFYQAQDWKEYQILIHALKSSMLSVGALKLSEMAKKLETACKKMDVEYILKEHAACMEEYERVIAMIGGSSYIVKKKEESELREFVDESTSDTQTNTVAIEETEFSKLVEEFDEAAFSFDKDEMLRIVECLQGCSFNGHDLTEPLASIENKVQMDDYMSAGEALMKLKDKWKQN